MQGKGRMSLFLCRVVIAATLLPSFLNADFHSAFNNRFWEDVPNLKVSLVKTRDDALPLNQLISLQKSLLQLEATPDDTLTWMRGSKTNNPFLKKLVDPKKFPYIRGVTKTVGISESQLLNISNFQMLPALASKDKGSGGRIKFLSYINNLHPVQFAEVYRNLENVVDQAMPLFEQVLSQLKKHNESAAGNLRTDNLQLIIGMDAVDIPPNSRSPAGVWQRAGARGESVLAIAVFYYDAINLRKSRILFRIQTDEQKSNFIAFQNVNPKTNRVVVFPNIYEHKISKFKLAEDEVDGRCGSITMMLVDPSVKVLSTADVLPQRQAWQVKKGPEVCSGRDETSYFPTLNLKDGCGCCSVTDADGKRFYNEMLRCSSD